MSPPRSSCEALVDSIGEGFVAPTSSRVLVAGASLYGLVMTSVRSASLVALVAALSLTACGDDDAPTSDGGLDAGACTSDESCDDGRFCNGPERCELATGTCRASAPPCTTCDEALDECAPDECPDLDGDGHADVRCGGDDCDDADETRSPSLTEVCVGRDSHDEDCDPTTIGDTDRDGDGQVSILCCNEGTCGPDCDDNDPATLTGQLEICDDRDNDCDGAVDEEENFVPWHPDRDGDLFGDATAAPVLSCEPVPDHSIRATDCDDTRPTINPAGVEVCNGLDDDCDGTLDEGLPTCSPCDPNPCENGASCAVRNETEFVCACTTGFVGATCEATCDVEPAYAEAPEGRATEINHVRGAALLFSSHRDDGVVATCVGPCASRFAADGQRCGDSTRSPVALSALETAGERWRADWSARGAGRIDRIEVYGVLGDDATGLDGAEILVDGFVVATFPAGQARAAFVFDPPLYGSSVEIRKTRATQRVGLAEVEVWGARETPVSDVAFLGAASQSSVLSTNEAVAVGGHANAAPMNAVDGRSDTRAITKPFRRAGTLALTGQTYPFGTGNVDETPTVGRDAAWWWLELGRPQTVRSVQIHRGDTPSRLDGAMVYLVIGDAIEATPRWTLAAGGSAIERLRPSAPIANVTGVKIVSALDAVAAPGVAAASLELREVRVWADTPARGAESLRDLTAGARVDVLRDRTRSDFDFPLDGDLSTSANADNVDGSWMRWVLRAPHDVRRVDLYKRATYPGTTLFSPTGCPLRPLCGDTYGGCSFRTWGAELREIDGAGGQVGDPLAIADERHVETFAVERGAVAGLELFKAGYLLVPTPACPSGYGTEPMMEVAEARAYGYWGASGATAINYAARHRAASVSMSPDGGDARVAAWRAFDSWTGDFARTTGVGTQELLVVLARPVLAERIVIVGADADGPSEARLELLLDGGLWETVTTLPRRVNHEIVLPPGRLVSAVRLRKTDRALGIAELEVLAVPRY